MPCNDCSRTETCPPCPNEEEPKGSGPSSTELCECGHPVTNHHWHAPRGEACIGNRNLCRCRMFRAKPKPCTCGPDEACGDPCTQQCPTACSEGHTYSGSCMHRAYGPDPECKCHHPLSEHINGGCLSCRMAGLGILGNHKFIGPEGLVPAEPPLTPEEEEEAPEDECETCRGMLAGWCRDCGRRVPDGSPLPPPEGPEYTPCVCGHIMPEHTVTGGQICMIDECGCVAYRTKPDFELPPQPDRRPPIAVAYSVQGHLYEVALPGDATVRAVDGALVIQHALGPVAGIVQVLPVINEEQA